MNKLLLLLCRRRRDGWDRSVCSLARSLAWHSYSRPV